MKFLVLNGVNLGRTGMREKGVYGTDTLESINKGIANFVKAHGHEADGEILGFGKNSYYLALESFWL